MKLKAELKDVDRVLVFMAAVKNQIPFALATALTRTAQNAKRSIEAEMPRAFDTPTRWTLNSLRLEAARKTKLQAVVAVKDRVSRGNPALFWLAPEVDGGSRGDKRAEMALKTAGLLPSGMQVVPGRGAKLNRFGNMTKGAISKAAAGAQASEEKQSQEGQAKYFVMRRAGRPIGIAARFSKSRMDIVMAFVSSASYQARLDFYGVGQKAVDRTLSAEVTKSLEQAIRTAK
ncbi:hypothetical protein [Denitrificimonas caeni]|uniref:hypothetical protein n=1 Tax=Denitrificimonas caeni TaxID=521720 RepID=UPI001E43B96A|nr:hypothetical protein [Denitrificimonas caeni]